MSEKWGLKGPRELRPHGEEERRDCRGFKWVEGKQSATMGRTDSVIQCAWNKALALSVASQGSPRPFGRNTTGQIRRLDLT
jgi:hypothetical protein